MNQLAFWLFASSGVPAWSTIFFIAGAAFWVVSVLVGAFRSPWEWDRGIGLGLMVFAIGLRVVFGV